MSTSHSRLLRTAASLAGFSALLLAPAPGQVFDDFKLVNSSYAEANGATFRNPVLAVDFNRDGLDDLATIHSGGAAFAALTLYEHLPGGGFGPGREILRGFAVVDAAFGDLDGDDDLDLVCLQRPVALGSFETEIVRLELIGNGRHVERWRLPLPTSATGEAATGVWLHDLDRDGALDLVYASTKTLVFYRGLANGSFEPEVTIVSGTTEIQSVLLVDVDEDGLDDVVYDSERFGQMVPSRIQWVPHVAPGQFGTLEIIESDIGFNSQMIASDVDGDGAKDLVRTDFGGISWYRNEPLAAFGPRQTLSDVIGLAYHLVHEDIDGDGDMDFYCSVQEPFGGTLLVTVLQSGGSYVFGEQVLPGFSFGDQVCAIDVDLDGYVDPVTDEYEWARYVPGVQNATPRTIQDPVRPTRLVAFDADNDGDVDVLTFEASGPHVRYFERIERDLFQRSARLPNASFGVMATGQPCVADLDGDGYQDVAAVSAALPSQVTIVPGGSSGPLPERRVSLLQASNGQPCAVDIDDDGDMDLVIPGSPPAGLHVLENDGTGGFAATSTVDASVDALQCAAIDMNGDGRPDLLVEAGSASGSELLVYFARPSGFDPAVIAAAPALGITAYAALDADRDSWLDIALVTPTSTSDQQVNLYQQTPSQSFAVPSLLFDTVGISWVFQHLGALDVTGDGLDDILLRGGTAPRTGLLRSSGGGNYDTLTTLDLRSEKTGSLGFIIADADGDLDLDVFTGEGSQRVAWWLENAQTSGTNYCDAVPNSTGQSATISATGWEFASLNSLSLTATELPSFSYGYFLVSPSAGLSVNHSGSDGNLCLSGTIGHYRQPGEIRSSGAEGLFSLHLDLTATPSSMGNFSVTAGQSLQFQAWYRDSGPAGATSNFTDGVRVDFL